MTSFGRGLRFDGADDEVVAADSSGLDSIASGLTLSFWLRPDKDYVDTATGAYEWSVGRVRLWRLGFYGPAQGVRFEVRDGSNNLHAVQAI